MVNSDLFLLFKGLTNKEIKALSAYIDSPITNKIRYRQEAQYLIKILQKHIAGNTIDKLDKTTIYHALFPDKPFVNGLLERVMFELTQAIRIFWTVERYLDDSNTLEMQLDYAEILQRKGILSKASYVVNHTLEEIKNQSFLSTKGYGIAFDAAYLAYSLATHKNKQKNDLEINQALKYLEFYYVINKLELINHYLLLNKFSRVEINLDTNYFGTGIHIPITEASEAPVIYIAHKIYCLLQENHPKPEGFETLLQLLTQYEAQLEAVTAKNFFAYLRNYCAFLVNDGYWEFFPVLHQIHLDNLSKGYLLHQGKITVSAYLNVANIALRAHKHEWAFDFIQQYRDKVIEASDSEQIYDLNMANYYFYRKDFDKALDFLPAASENLEYHLFARKLELRIYYEIKSDLLEYKLEAFKMYIRRASQKTITESNRERHANFANLLHQLASTMPGDRTRAQRLLDRMEGKQVAEKEWLIEQIKKILKK